MPEKKAPKIEPRCLCYRSNRMSCSRQGCVNRPSESTWRKGPVVGSARYGIRPDAEIHAIVASIEGRKRRSGFWFFFLLAAAFLVVDGLVAYAVYKLI